MGNVKLKSSALLIAISLGIILSAVLTGAVLMIAQQTKSSGQDREGQMAYRAALSGIEDGLLRYKYARSQGKESLIFGDLETNQAKQIMLPENDSPAASYNLSVKMEAISVGSNLEDGNFDEWQSTPNKAIAQNALPLLCDNTLDIDLSYLKNNIAGDKKLKDLTIYFSKPFYFIDGVYNSFTAVEGKEVFSAVNYQLVDLTKTGEEQLLEEKTNNEASNHSLPIASTTINSCASNSECHLKIKPQAVVGINNDFESFGRFNASGVATTKSKYIFFKIKALDSSDNVILPTADKPGAIIVEAVGKAGEAQRKLQAKIDASTGAYVGLADFGIFCGKNCQMPSASQSITPAL